MTYKEFKSFINKECNFNKSMLRAIDYQDRYVEKNKISYHKLKTKDRIPLDTSFNLSYVEKNNLVLDIYCYEKEDYIESTYPIDILIDDKYAETIKNLIDFSVKEFDMKMKKSDLEFKKNREKKLLEELEEINADLA